MSIIAGRWQEQQAELRSVFHAQSTRVIFVVPLLKAAQIPPWSRCLFTVVTSLKKEDSKSFLREVKDFSSQAFHLTLFRGNRQNEAELKPN